jgi:membrane protein DedA with SNARE-associated domain
MIQIIDPIVTFCTNFIGSWGLPAVFLLMVLESACIPVPSEAIMLFAGFAVSKGDMSLAGAVTVGVAGNLLGSWVAYWVGLYGGRPFIDRYGKYVLLRHHHLDIAERWFARYGAVAVFFSRILPIVRTFISLPAGMARMPFWKFTLYTAAGSVPWVLMLGYVGVKVGDNWEKIQARLHYLDYTVVAAVLFLIAWWVVHRRRNPAPAAKQ